MQHAQHQDQDGTNDNASKDHSQHDGTLQQAIAHPCLGWVSSHRLMIRE
jgi:hypothetical protein